jgi:hypothetical protein
MPLWTLHGAEIMDPIFRDTDHPVRNDRVHLHTLFGKPFYWNTCVAHSELTLSKKPEMSKRRRAPMLPICLVVWILCMSVVMVSMALCFGWDPNCDMGRRLVEIISAFTLLATIFSKSLATHSKRLMGW